MENAGPGLALQVLAYTAPGHGPQQPPEAPALKKELEQEKLRTKTLLEEVERRGFEAGAAAARAEGKEAQQALERTLRLSIDALDRAAIAWRSHAETEVVALSLAIARKVLGHEAQLDRLLLAGAVRSAVERLHPRTEAVLLVAPEDLSAWQKHFAGMPSDRLRIEADATLTPGSCLCRSGASVLDLRVEAQLGEITRKFAALYDLADQPDEGPPASAAMAVEKMGVEK